MNKLTTPGDSVAQSLRASSTLLSGALLFGLTSVLALASSCTLTSDPFEPQLLSAAVDAGALLLPEPDAAPVGAEPAATPCSLEGSEGGLNGADPSCTDGIGLIADPPDAGSIATLPVLSLPPCEGELGEFGEPEPISGLDFAENSYGPALSPDGRTLYFSAYVADQQEIYSATRGERGTRFSDVQKLDVVSSSGADGSPFLSPHEPGLYFFSDREGGSGNRDVWFSPQAASGALGAPEPVPGVNSGSSDLLPWVSGDGLVLAFVSSRPGGRGGADLWRAIRPGADEPFGAPANIDELNSDQNEGRLVFSADNLTAFFTSDRSGGRGGPDIWTATRPSRGQPFTTPRNLGALNSAAADLDVMLSSDQTELFFASSRSGVTELWLAERRCEP